MRHFLYALLFISVFAGSSSILAQKSVELTALLSDGSLEPQDWAISDSDLKLKIVEVQVPDGDHKFSTSRRFETSADLAMIDVAEAIFPKAAFNQRSAGKDSAPKRRSVGSAPEENPPYWSVSNQRPGSVKIAQTISKRAIAYYQDLAVAVRKSSVSKNTGKRLTFFNYAANAKFVDECDFAGRKFSRVYVVSMELKWSAYCGPMCAFAYIRRKVVVFDENRTPVALFINPLITVAA